MTYGKDLFPKAPISEEEAEKYVLAAPTYKDLAHRMSEVLDSPSRYDKPQTKEEGPVIETRGWTDLFILEEAMEQVKEMEDRHNRRVYASRYDKPLFAGPDVLPSDLPRLKGQLTRVRELMNDGAWRSLAVIAEACGCSTQAASARLRDLRKAKFGGYTVSRQRHTRLPLFLYRLERGP